MTNASIANSMQIPLPRSALTAKGIGNGNFNCVYGCATTTSRRHSTTTRPVVVVVASCRSIHYLVRVPLRLRQCNDHRRPFLSHTSKHKQHGHCGMANQYAQLHLYRRRIAIATHKHPKHTVASYVLMYFLNAIFSIPVAWLSYFFHSWVYTFGGEAKSHFSVTLKLL